MMGQLAEIGAFEAKTRLSELLRETENGRSFIICKRGKAVARLIPPEKKEQQPDLTQILASFRAIRQQIPGRLRIRELIERGRRY
ncbi:MAG: type II toxin-antitoxin system Phd/YefM family antitoxin [Candidatus Methylomirabilia bacterium]